MAYNHLPQPAEGSALPVPNHIRGFFEMFDSRITGSDYVGEDALGSDVISSCDVLPRVLRTEHEYKEGLTQARGTNWTIKGLTHEEEGIEESSPAKEERYSEQDDHCACCGAAGCGGVGLGRDSDVSSMSSSYNFSAQRDYEPGREVESFEEARTLVHDCSLLVGMHPDQAAEHLIDFGLRNQKPFAVVPCCVYHRQFPHRCA